MPPITFNGEDLIISIKLPTIGIEYALEEEYRKNTSVIDVNDTDTLRKTLGEIFISEITKYIVSITIKDSTIDFTKLKFKDRISVLERIPNKAIQQVIEYIDDCKLTIDAVSTVTIKEKGTDKEIKEKIDMDSAFFNIK